jgi:bacteriocin-like protein
MRELTTNELDTVIGGSVSYPGVYLQELLRVSDAGQRDRRDIHQWPVSESRQGKNPRGMGRGECRALRYGDLADAEGVSAGAPCPLRRLVTWLAGGHSSG